MGSCQSTEATGGNGEPDQASPVPDKRSPTESAVVSNGHDTFDGSRNASNSPTADDRSVDHGKSTAGSTADDISDHLTSPTEDPLGVSHHSMESAKSLGSTHSSAAHSRANGTGASSTGETTEDSGSVGSGGGLKNRKCLAHSSSIIGLDSMIESRREEGGLTANVVHMEVPFGKPIEEVYDGVHTGPVLGSGISGLVRLVTHKATGVKYAVKCLDLGLVDTAAGLQQLREEIFIMCQLDHPNIVRLEEVYESHSEIYLVQELCLGGELFDRLDEQPDYHYTEAECARLVKQMLCAVRYLHSKGIIHRDLKLENFLFSSTAQDSELKMIDFGLSKHFRYGEVQHEAVGTPYTVAPEVIRGNYDEKCDIWAVGVIAFLLLSGDPPFGGCGGPEPLLTVRSNILRGSFYFEPEEIWCLVSQKAKDFIRFLLVLDPKSRPTARDAQKHTWLREWANKTRTEDDHILNPNVVKALVTFKEFSDMRKLLCEVLSFTLLPDQIKELRKEFEKMDTDGSGEISLSALKQVLVTNAGAGSLGALTEEEVEDIFNAMRVNKTEARIHWHEFIAAGLSQCQVDDRNLRLAFDRLDSDHKGYVTLDDIMDLVGNGSLQSEEAMRKMWGDSMKAVNCIHHRITYEDFLLLMKGQTREPSECDQGFNSSQVINTSQRLMTVPEDVVTEEKVDGGGLRRTTNAADGVLLEARLHVPQDHIPQASIPLTPIMSAGLSDEVEMETPLSMDDDDDIAATPIGESVVYACSNPQVSLTPPTTPKRGPEDYLSPLSDRLRLRVSDLPSAPGLEIPGLSNGHPPVVYVRKRSRSMGDGSEETSNDNDSSRETDSPKSPPKLEALHLKPELVPPTFSADARRAVTLPEHESGKLTGDKNKSALQVNRQLYRAHRQMRLSVVEASKRFEEQQARHARDILVAQAEDGVNGGMIQAGLVMRRGQGQTVTSEAVNKLLQENLTQQQALVEKANKRGGRGRRTRTKTISDMSGMVGSLSQDQLHGISIAAAAEPSAEIFASNEEGDSTCKNDPPETNVRGATVPGEFRKVSDPFGANGKYGSHLVQSK